MLLGFFSYCKKLLQINRIEIKFHSGNFGLSYFSTFYYIFFNFLGDRKIIAHVLLLE